MSYLLDTSFLVRLANKSDPLHGVAVEALTELFQQDTSLFIAPQNLIEFWSVCTRPLAANGGLGLSAGEAISIVDVFAIEFLVAPETPDVYSALRKLLGSVPVLGKQVHDARLAAVCHVHNIQNLVTFNVRHFKRFENIPPGLHAVDPKQVAKA